MTRSLNKKIFKTITLKHSIVSNWDLQDLQGLEIKAVKSNSLFLYGKTVRKVHHIAQFTTQT